MKYYTVREAAEVMELSVCTVYRMIKSNVIHVENPGEYRMLISEKEAKIGRYLYRKARKLLNPCGRKPDYMRDRA